MRKTDSSCHHCSALSTDWGTMEDMLATVLRSCGTSTRNTVDIRPRKRAVLKKRHTGRRSRSFQGRLTFRSSRSHRDSRGRRMMLSTKAMQKPRRKGVSRPSREESRAPTCPRLLKAQNRIREKAIRAMRARRFFLFNSKK